MELKEPSDGSNSLLALDGEVANLSGIGMEMSTMLRVTLRINDISYSCTVQCERDKGTVFGTALLLMGKSRLIILCEIPEGLELASVELDMDVAAGSEEYSFYFCLQKLFPSPNRIYSEDLQEHTRRHPNGQDDL